MNTMRIRLATTHVDSHNERFDLRALEDGVRSVRDYYIPMWYEHDPRIPPLGRMVDAEIVEIEDGEFALEAIVEMFDGEGPIPFKRDRRMRTKELADGDFLVSYDRNMLTEEDQTSIRELAEAFGTKPLFEGKKALDPISVLTIGGTFVAGGIASGLFQALGADLYDVLKTKVKEVMNRRKEGERDRLFKFHSSVLVDGRSVDVEVIMTNPSPEDIDSFFDSGLGELDHLVPRYLSDPSVARIVLDYQDKTLEIKFGVREDCAPLKWRAVDHDAQPTAVISRKSSPGGDSGRSRRGGLL